ncbi:hypothetical protein [Roseovarius aquimarinus]|uniref:Lipoprotein n=1 Tax=Roseovarius aquimarinus TaxID=1229156 RepID=A0ABW7I4U1_9RHOB
MSNALKSLMALGLVVAVSACQQAPEDDFVVVEPEPITMEPAPTGKYGKM